MRDWADVHDVKIFNLVLAEAFTNDPYRQNVLVSENGLTIGESTVGIGTIFKEMDWKKILENWVSIEDQLDSGIVPDEARFNWKPAEKRIQFAEENNMQVMAFHLVYAEQLPDALMSACKNKDDFAKLMKFTTKARALHFKGRIQVWSGVNEIATVRLYNNQTQKTSFTKKMVDNDLIHNVFVWLKEADPNATSLLSESWVVEYTSRPNYQNIHNEYFKLLDDLIARNTPVDAGGMHNHFWAYDPPRPDVVKEVIQEFADREKKAHAIETDVSLNPVFPLTPTRAKSVASLADPLEAQAKIFVDMLDAFVSRGNIFGMFGITDAFSWYDELDKATGYDGPGAHIFDKAYQPKPAYTRMVDYLKSLPKIA